MGQKNLQVRMSEDDPREGKTLNDWYLYIKLEKDKTLNVDTSKRNYTID
jgi:hypothetical protein